MGLRVRSFPAIGAIGAAARRLPVGVPPVKIDVAASAEPPAPWGGTQGEIRHSRSQSRSLPNTHTTASRDRCLFSQFC